jgi:hypothetical protein
MTDADRFVVVSGGADNGTKAADEDHDADNAPDAMSTSKTPD